MEFSKCWQLILITLILLFTCSSQAQEIEIVNVFGAYRPVYEGEKLNLDEFKELLSTNMTTYTSAKKYASARSLSNVMCYIGAGFVAWPVGTSIVGKDPNWTQAVIGVGLIVTSIPFQIMANKRLKEATRIYNTGLSEDLGNYKKPNSYIQFGVASVSLIF